MPEITSYEPGEPVGVELSSPNLQTSKIFYRGLFGWGWYTVADSRTGDHILFTLDADNRLDVAGLTALADDTTAPTWTCYFSVSDLDTAVTATREAGGQVHIQQAEIANMGRLALADDPQGAGIGLWQPYDHPGAAVVDEPNSMCWVELTCRDVTGAHDFYGHVLGWSNTAEYQGLTSHPSYLWRNAGRPVASLMRIDPADDAPAQWIPHFAVADCEVTAGQAVRLGGTVEVPCKQTTHGRYALIKDPTSASLVVIQRGP